MGELLSPELLVTPRALAPRNGPLMRSSRKVARPHVFSRPSCVHSAASEHLRTALLHLRQAERAASILRELTECLPGTCAIAPETCLPLLEKAVALARAVRAH